MNCTICNKPFQGQWFRWTDTHGIGACTTCGAAYTIYHYNSNNQRINLPPRLQIKDEYVPLFKTYWQEKQRNVMPCAFNFRGSDYEVATQEDLDEWEKCLGPKIEALRMVLETMQQGEDQCQRKS